MKHARLAATLLTACMATPAVAGGGTAATVAASDAPAGVAATIRTTLTQRLPDTPIIDVVPAPVAGWYEVFLGDSIVYADATGDHVFVGSLLDTRERRDLTAARLDQRNGVEFGSLPLEKAIKVVKGNGARRMAVFSDPDCPYCRKLEKTLATATDVTIYTFLYPIADLHPDAATKAQSIWCATDREAAWTAWMVDGVEPAAARCDGVPIDDLQKLGRELRIHGTPTILMSDGRRYGGALPADKLEAALAEAAKTAVAGISANGHARAESAAR
jgi:thiol:disulfide interchange protein DsbC